MVLLIAAICTSARGAPAQLPLAGERLCVENPTSKPAESWTSCGAYAALPADRVDAYALELPGIGTFPAFAHGREVMARVALPPRTRVAGTLRAAPAELAEHWRWFRFSPWVADELSRPLPRFLLEDGATVAESNRCTLWLGTGPKPSDFVEIAEDGPARLVLHFRTRFESAVMTVEGWLYVWSRSELVDFEIRATYGTTASGQPRERAFGSLRMRTGEEPVIDYRVPKGLDAPVLVGTGPAAEWDAEIAAPMSWLRARTVEVTGALLCRPTPPASATGPAAANLEHRREAPLVSMLLGWQGRYLAFGVLPRPPANAVAEQQRRRDRLAALLAHAGGELDPRFYAQPPHSGTTGDQAEFGASRCEHAVSMGEPWALWDLRYHVQAEGLRPVANREPSGAPIDPAAHARAQLVNRVPHDTHSRGDMLGWPLPVGWITTANWPPEDSQHTCDNLLWGLIALRPSRSLERTAADLLTCDLLGYVVGGQDPRDSGGQSGGDDPHSRPPMVRPAGIRGCAADRRR